MNNNIFLNHSESFNFIKKLNPIKFDFKKDYVFTHDDYNKNKILYYNTDYLLHTLISCIKKIIDKVYNLEFILYEQELLRDKVDKLENIVNQQDLLIQKMYLENLIKDKNI